MSRQPTGWADSAAERMRRWRKRQRARGLKPVVSWVARSGAVRRLPLERRLLEARTLALCVMAVDKIEREPELLDVVYQNFERWESRNRAAPGCAIRAWRAVLRLP